MASSAKALYDPKKSQVGDDKLAEFLGGTVDAELKTVPGVGPKAKELLEAAGVENTYQLIGKFLTLKSSKATTQQHCDAFYEWLVEIGIRSHRSGIVRAIAEKTNSCIYGVYDEDDL